MAEQHLWQTKTNFKMTKQVQVSLECENYYSSNCIRRQTVKVKLEDTAPTRKKLSVCSYNLLYDVYM